MRHAALVATVARSIFPPEAVQPAQQFAAPRQTLDRQAFGRLKVRNLEGPLLRGIGLSLDLFQS